MPNVVEQRIQIIKTWIAATASGPAGGPGSEAYALSIRAQKDALAANALQIDENMVECKRAVMALDQALKAISDADKQIGQIARAINLVAKALDAAEKLLTMVGAA